MLRKCIVLWLLAVFQTAAYAIEETSAVSVSTILKTQTTWNGEPIAYPSGTAEVTGMMIEIAVGGETGWHSHPVPSFAVIVEGELEVWLRNGDVKKLKSGDALAEVINTAHNGRNVGTKPVRIFVFYTGTVNGQLSNKEVPQ